MSKSIYLVHSDKYKEWIFDETHPTQEDVLVMPLNSFGGKSRYEMSKKQTYRVGFIQDQANTSQEVLP